MTPEVGAVATLDSGHSTAGGLCGVMRREEVADAVDFGITF